MSFPTISPNQFVEVFDNAGLRDHPYVGLVGCAHVLLNRFGFPDALRVCWVVHQAASPHMFWPDRKPRYRTPFRTVTYQIAETLFCETPTASAVLDDAYPSPGSGLDEWAAFNVARAQVMKQFRVAWRALDWENLGCEPDAALVAAALEKPVSLIR